MPEQLLDDAQVGSTLEQMGRERVAQRMRADSIGEAGPRCGALDRGPRLLASEPPAAIAEEEWAAAERRDVADGEERDARAAHPASEPIEGNITDRHEPFLVAFADDADEGAVDREVFAVEADRLADPETGRVQELEQGAVPQGVAGYAAGPAASAASSVSAPPAASSNRSISSTVSVSGSNRDGRGRSRCAATSTPINPSP
jgi:hypothetical protein